MTTLDELSLAQDPDTRRCGERATLLMETALQLSGATFQRPEDLAKAYTEAMVYLTGAICGIAAMNRDPAGVMRTIGRQLLDKAGVIADTANGAIANRREPE